MTYNMSSGKLNSTILYLSCLVNQARYLSSEHLCIFGLHGVIYIYNFFVAFFTFFCKLSMVGLTLTWLTNPLSSSAVTLLNGLFDP